MRLACEHSPQISDQALESTERRLAAVERAHDRGVSRHVLYQHVETARRDQAPVIVENVEPVETKEISLDLAAVLIQQTDEAP